MTAPIDRPDHRADPPVRGLLGLPSGYEIRPARPGDLSDVPVIERAAGQIFHGIGMHDIADDDGLAPEVYESARASGRLWVATHHETPVAYVLALRLEDQPHLEQLSVDPEHGRRGLGAALVDVVLRWAATVGGTDLTLSTFRDVAWNRQYYQQLGFEVVDDGSLSPALQAVRAHEAAEGLDVDRRVIMRRRL